MKTAVGVLVGLVLTAVVVTLVVTRSWQATTGAFIGRLDSVSVQSSPPSLLIKELDSLPAPVARYLRTALGSTEVNVTRARIRWSGQFLVHPEASGWAPFEANQVLTTYPPGFVWDARIRMAPGIATYVRDAFVDGHGFMRGAVLGAITVVDAPPTPELDAAALQRYLAEAVWLPTALFPSHGVGWSPLTDTSARASLSAGGITVTLDFHFGPDGLVESVFTPSRFRDWNGSNVPTPWEGRFTRYEERGGLEVPVEAEVAWLLPERRLTYWRGVPIEIHYTWSGL
jgi:hypothetical protein